MTDWDLTVGLEIHAQLSTNSKLFSSAPVDFNQEPNSCVSIIDLAMPGMLPTLNQNAVVKAIRAGLALQGKINLHSSFDRKHYTYPDLPQGYQITQFFKPIVENAKLDIQTENGPKTITIRCIHMEQDAGKSIHDQGINHTYLDYNRCGVPLIEIVTNPDFKTTDEVVQFLHELRRILRYVESSNADMEKGSMRCDANVSIAPKGSNKMGTRCEIKNLNSTRHIKMAIDAEIKRQAEIIKSGKKIVQSTCLYNEETNTTAVMRSKEDASEYFYLKDGDLPIVDLTHDFVDEIRHSLPALPRVRHARYVKNGVDPSIAEILIENREIADFMDEVGKKCNLKIASNWFTTEIFGMMNKENKSLSDLNLAAENFAEFINLIEKKIISSKIAKEILPKILENDESPQKIVKNLGLEQIDDDDLLIKIIDEILTNHPKEIEQYRNGKTRMLSFFVGQAMKMTKGKGNPQKINEILLGKLN